MKLAVIGKIVKVQPIEGADRIRQATVVCGDAGKWQGVVGLDIAVGDLVTVFLQDAVLPPDPRWQFMDRTKWRVKMARFKGVPSECVIIPLIEPAGGSVAEPLGISATIGYDQTEELGVTKFSKPLPESMNGIAKGNFPSFIPKTDEPNFQTVPDLVEALFAESWVATLKCDGTSCTVWNDDTTGAMRVASRNLELEEFTPSGAGNAYWRSARLYDFTKLPIGCALQYEVVGPGIQKNPLGLTEIEGRAFTLYNYQTHQPMSRDELVAATEAIGIPLAPALFSGHPSLPASADRLRSMADITYPTGKPGEGIVLRTLDSRISFKVINLSYKD
jgi:RNA ligase (TIGR02306 family)